MFDHALPWAYGHREGRSCLDGVVNLISRQDALSRYRVGCVARRGPTASASPWHKAAYRDICYLVAVGGKADIASGCRTNAI
jgi:hypothetical protein